MNILVLGIGNILLQDEGAGVHALQRFEDAYHIPQGVELLDGGTSGMDLLQYLYGRDHLILLDVARTGKAPGTIVRLEGAEVPAFFRNRISPHQLGLSDLLAAASLIGALPGRVLLLGIEPASLDTGLELSEVVDRGVDRLVERVAAELKGLGLDVIPQKVAATA